MSFPQAAFQNSRVDSQALLAVWPLDKQLCPGVGSVVPTGKLLSLAGEISHRNDPSATLREARCPREMALAGCEGTGHGAWSPSCHHDSQRCERHRQGV